MNCKKAQLWLQGYVDGELPLRRLKRVRRHVDECPDCGTLLTRLSELKTLLAENRVPREMDATPEFFWSQLKAKIEGEPQIGRFRQAWFEIRWPRVLALSGAWAAVLVVAAVVSMRTLPQSQSTPAIAQSAPAQAQVEKIETSGPDLYAGAYHSSKSNATIIWTEGMPVVSLEL